jgi:hypothetical protein
VIIIGVGHKSRQGKDQLCDYLVSHLRIGTRGKRIVKAGFADQLKMVVHQLWGWTGIKEPEHYEKVPSDRNIIIPHFNKNVVQVWIEFGNHCREFDPYVWINALLRGSNADVLILKDARFPNEVKAIKDNGGYVFKVERPGVEGLPSVSDNALNDYTEWDEVVVNSAGLWELNLKAQYLGDKYCKGLFQ